MNPLRVLISILAGTFIGLTISVIKIVCFVYLFALRCVLPDKLFWTILPYIFTQYHWQFFLEYWGRITYTWAGECDVLPYGEPALMIANHQDDLDFGIFIAVYRKQGIYATQCKFVTKQSIRYVPFFGWIHWLIGDLYLKRNYDSDAPNIKKWLSRFKERGFKRLVIFPEGTRSRNRKKLEESQIFAKKNDLPVLENVLIPRTKGFAMLADYFREHPGQCDHVYDITFGYGGGGVGIPRFLSGPIYTDVHIHITRHAIKQIGSCPEDYQAWCLYRFQVKDQLMGHFHRHGHFPSNKELAKIEESIKAANITKAKK